MSKYSENMPPDIKDAIGWMYPHVKPESTLLDFGCSTGYFGAFIKQQKHCSVDGVEISDDAIEARKVLDKVYSFDLDGEWPKAIFSKQYDYIFFGDVLEHLKSPGEVLTKCLQLLKPEGVIFVSVPNIAHMSTRLELIAGNFEYESMGILDNTHLKYFTLKSFTNMAIEAGYGVASIDSSTNDYPTKITQKILTKVGLAPNEKFWKMADEIEARAFQYKFILKPAKGALKAASKKHKELPRPVKPASYRDAYIEDLEQKVKNLTKHASDQQVMIKEFSATNKSLQQQIEFFKKRNAKLESILLIRVARKLRSISKKKR